MEIKQIQMNVVISKNNSFGYTKTGRSQLKKKKRKEFMQLRHSLHNRTQLTEGLQKQGNALMEVNIMEMVEKACSIPVCIMLPSKSLDHNQKELFSKKKSTFFN